MVLAYTNITRGTKESMFRALSRRARSSQSMAGFRDEDETKNIKPNTTTCASSLTSNTNKRSFQPTSHRSRHEIFFSADRASRVRRHPAARSPSAAHPALRVRVQTSGLQGRTRHFLHASTPNPASPENHRCSLAQRSYTSSLANYPPPRRSARRILALPPCDR